MSEAGRKKVLKEIKENEDYEELTDSPFCFNGEGITQGARSTLFNYDVKAGKLRRLTDTLFTVDCFEVIGGAAYVIGRTVENREEYESGLYRIDLATGSFTELVRPYLHIMEIGKIQDKLIILGSECKRYGENENPFFYVYDTAREEKDFTLLREADESVFDGVISDIEYGSWRSLKSDGNHVYYMALDGTRNVLELARRSKVKGFLYLSSLEVYGVPAEGHVKMQESEAGYIDSMKVRSCYSEGKRMVECLCASYASEYGVPVKVVRLSQTFGAGVAYVDGRVFAQFARSAIEGTDIVLKTKGETLRNYCYTADAVTALLLVLVNGSVGEAYNVANKDTAISIADMAKFVCDKFSGGRSKVVFDIAEDATKLGYNPVVKICLDTAKLEGLGWKAEFGLEEMFRRTIESMKLERD